MMNQYTLKSACSFSGRGLHTGKPVNVKICPAPVDTGIVFVRTDLGGARVPALATNVRSTRRSTQLAVGRAKVGTVEHVLSALTGLGIDNAVVELDNVEMPILDGSAKLYTEAIEAVGTVDQGVPRKWIKLKKEIIVRNEKKGAWIKVTPAGEPGVELTIDFPSKVLGKQTVNLVMGDSYAKEVAPCRTFCFLQEIMPQLMLGLIKGGDVSNAIVIIDKPVSRCRMSRLARILRKDVPEVLQPGFMAEGGLRFPNECARHKLLDLIGDIRLCGGIPSFRIEAYKAGHRLNTAAAKEILKNL